MDPGLRRDDGRNPKPKTQNPKPKTQNPINTVTTAERQPRIIEV